MLGTLLDVADAHGRTRPARGEVVGLRLHGLRAWADSVVPSAVRGIAASIGAGSALGFALVYGVFVVWGPWDARPLQTPGDLRTFGPFWNAGILVVVPLALMALAAAVRSRWGVYLLAVLAVLGAAAAWLLGRSDESWNGPHSTTTGVTLLLILLANCGDPRHRGAFLWGLAVVGGGLASYAVLFPSSGRPFHLTTVTDSAMWTVVAPAWMLAAAGALLAILVVVLLVQRRQELAASLSIAWIPWGAAGAIALRWFANERTDAVIMVIGSATLVLVSLTVVALRRTPRRAVSH
ncbi:MULTISPECIES: hypothetical protein [Curtobacterium]|uniref:hypothetical protein n=1 Tax=Curtobacterium TaxID=2034 RepID=UPI0015F64150|nr:MULTISPECIES: hypothetical protein [Curtobacterium]MBO9041244.1 hypothetical protein [Curtobacterium flaccumfaciens pv. flaccumfaciens]